MIVTWTIPEQQTPLPHQQARVHYGSNNSSGQLQSVKAEVEHFDDDEAEYCTYRALLKELKPNTTYCKLFIHFSSIFVLIINLR